MELPGKLQLSSSGTKFYLFLSLRFTISLKAQDPIFTTQRLMKKQKHYIHSFWID